MYSLPYRSCRPCRMPRPETSSDIPLQFSGQAPLATTPLIPLLPSYLTTITATPSTGPSDRSRGSVPGQSLYVRIERVTRSSRRDEKKRVAEETSPVAGASGPRRGKGEAAVTAPAAAPKKRRGRGRLPWDSDPERLAREYRNGDTPTPAAGRSMLDVVTITSSSPFRGEPRLRTIPPYQRREPPSPHRRRNVAVDAVCTVMLLSRPFVNRGKEIFRPLPLELAW